MGKKKMKRYNSGYDLLKVGSSEFKGSAPDTKINKKEPSYSRRIPIGEDARTGQTVYMRLKDEDRIGIFDRTGHGKTTLSKRLISGFYKGGANILIATDPKSDYVDIDKEGGASESLVDEHKAGLMETEKTAEVPQAIPKEMYIPRFLKEEVRNTELPNEIEPFAFDIDELSEAEFLTLMDTTSDTQQRAIKQAFRENNASIENLDELAPAHAPEEQSARALRDEVQSVQNEKILSGKAKYNKNPLKPLKRDKAVSISFQGYDNFMRGSSRKKLELYVAILLRKLKEMITNGEISGQTLIYLEESDVFAGDDASISREDIIRMIDLGRAYSIPMTFAAQRPQQLDDDGNNILGQMNHFFIGKTVDEDGYKRCLKIAKLWEGYGESSREFQKVFRNMGKYQWMYVDVANSRYKVIDAYAPLCSHDDDASHSSSSRQTKL